MRGDEIPSSLSFGVDQDGDMVVTEPETGEQWVFTPEASVKIAEWIFKTFALRN